MSYFFRTNGFDLDRYDFDIEVLPRFTKKEQEMFVLLLDNFNVEEEYSRINSSLAEGKEEDIRKLVLNLMKKTVCCTIVMDDGKKSELSFSIFDFIIREGREIIYKFSREIESARHLGNFYTRINLLGMLKFKYEYTKNIYKMILRKSTKKGSIEYTLDEFKKVMNIKEESYNRYYNLESKVLKPVIRDIESADVTLWFKKVKNTSAKTSRVVGIRIHYRDGVISQIHKDTNELMKRYSRYIRDFAKTYEIIYNFKKFNTFEDTVKYIEENREYIFSEE